MLLTSISFMLGEQRSGGLLILCAAGLKCAMVGWHFMDLRSAAFAWSAGLLFVAGIVLAMGMLA